MKSNYITEVKDTVRRLKQGKSILYPTDTVWGVGCDATNHEAVKAIFLLKKRMETKSLICLVSDYNMLNYYVEELPSTAYDILKYSNKPTTIIYDKPIRVSENLIASDNTLAIRIVENGFAHDVIKKLGRPIVSTSANLSGESTPKSFKEITKDILNGVDYVVNLQNEKSSQKPSAIIRLGIDGTVKIIRK